MFYSADCQEIKLASLEEQLKSANTDLQRAKDKTKVAESNTKDTRYGKFDPNSAVGKAALAKLTEATKKQQTAQTYYDNLLKAKNTKEEQDAITGANKGVSEEKQAALQGLTVE